jgi:ABC-type antimicrobial peptide transport system permease subunit
MFVNRYFFAVGIPFLLILLGALARKLIRSTTWVRDDFFLGVDLSLTGISSGLIYISDLLATKTASIGCSTPLCRDFLESVDERLANDATFISVALLFFLFILTIHQDQMRDGKSARSQWIALGVVSNLIGTGLLVWFILAVKGV